MPWRHLHSHLPLIALVLVAAATGDALAQAPGPFPGAQTGQSAQPSDLPMPTTGRAAVQDDGRRLPESEAERLPPPSRSEARRAAAAAGASSGQLAGFAPIGQLAASATIGTTPAEAEVSEADRPEISVPGMELITVSRSSVSPRWTPGSPTRSMSRHQPLYFEQPNLERYGTSRGRHLQPLCSAAHFGWSVATLPYQMALQNPRRVYRYSQPFEAGRWGYRQRSLPPPNSYAALVQSAAVLGMIFVLP